MRIFWRKRGNPLKGFEFESMEIFENKDTSAHSALFRGGAFCEIDAKGGKNKYIILSPKVLVLDPVSEEQVTTFDKNKKYSISGSVHAWDRENILGHMGIMMPSDLSFGTFILNPINVTHID